MGRKSGFEPLYFLGMLPRGKAYGNGSVQNCGLPADGNGGKVLILHWNWGFPIFNYFHEKLIQDSYKVLPPVIL